MRTALLVLLVALPVLASAGCFRAPLPPPEPVFPRHELTFSGSDAMEEIRAQMTLPNGSVRYRIPGTPGNAYVAGSIEEQLGILGLRTQFQNWGSSYACRDPTPLHNVVGVRQGATNRTVVLGAHFDTRPAADKERAAADRIRPVPGANDGASGVAVLLELADVLSDRAPNLTIVYAFFDAEDGGDLPRSRWDCSTGWIMGSLRFAGSWMPRNVPRSFNVTEGVIVVDMVGDPGLVMLKEGYSVEGPGAPLQDLIYDTGRRLGHTSIFVPSVGPKITDDHRAFLDAALVQGTAQYPAVDLIHLSDDPVDPFPATHHRLSDTIENVNPVSLEAVGRTLEHVLLDMDEGPRCAYVTNESACSKAG